MKKPKELNYQDIELLIETIDEEDDRMLPISMSAKQIGSLVESSLLAHADSTGSEVVLRIRIQKWQSKFSREEIHVTLKC